MKATALALLFALCGCRFAQTHPAVTVGIVGGVVGYGGCAIDSTKASTCAIIGGSAAVFLGGIVALVNLIADTSAHELPPDENAQEVEPGGVVRVHTHAQLPPGAIDAGVAAPRRAPVRAVDAGAAPASVVDAGAAPASAVDAGAAPASAVDGGAAPASVVDAGAAPASAVDAGAAPAATGPDAGVPPASASAGATP